jgi:hypothetical protein
MLRGSRALAETGPISYPSTTLKGCYEKALGAAIRSAKARTLTQI